MGSMLSGWTRRAGGRLRRAGTVSLITLLGSSLAGCGDLDGAAVGGAEVEKAYAGETLPDRSQDLKRFVPGAEVTPEVSALARPAFGAQRNKPRAGQGGARDAQRPAAFSAAAGEPREHWDDQDPEGHSPGRDHPSGDFEAPPEAGHERFGAEARRDLPPADDCPVCGRETGFLGQPVLIAEVGADKSVELTWDAVEGAEYYLVVALASGYEGDLELATEFQWRTNLTGLSLHLPDRQQYIFTVEARRERPKARSVASNAVTINL